MFATLRRMSLPLLVKELQEQAARRRTYLIRVLYVGLMTYLAMTSMAYQIQTSTPLNILGQGTQILTGLVNWQFWGIFLLLPGMACAVLTTEKERNTLALLFLTRLGPWTIIMEKLLSRLFPMSMFLMCGLPLMAFTYSMGGLTLFKLFAASYFLLLALLLTGCVAVMCSALCHTTVGAFIQTYFVLLAFAIAPHVFYFFLPQAFTQRGLETLFRAIEFSGLPKAGDNPLIYQYGIHSYILTQVFSPSALFASFNVPMMGPVRTPWLPAICFGLPSILSSIACLCVARWALYRRAFVTLSNPLLKFLRGIDKIFFWAHRQVPFDVKLVREADSLPDTEPIAWREVSKRSLGQFRYLVRIMIPLMFPVIFVGSLMITTPDLDFVRRNGLTPLVYFLWSVSLVLIMISASNAIPLERMRQSWDVLRSVPLTGQEILTQKLRGVRRLQWASSIPLLSTIALQTWWLFQVHQIGATTTARNFLWWEYLFGAVTSVVIYSELVKWISLWCGLNVRNAMRAMLLSVIAIGVISTVPQLLLVILANWILDPLMTNEYTLAMAVVSSMNPWIFTATNEEGELRRLLSIPLAPALIHAATQGGILWLIHRHIMQRAEWYLGRIGVPGATQARQQTRTEASAGAHPHSVPNRTAELSSSIVTAAASGEST